TRRGEPRLRDRLGHVHHRMRVQAGCARSENIDDLLAETRAASRCRDHQRTRHAEPRRFLAHLRERAAAKYNALRGKIMDEGGGHGCRIVEWVEARQRRNPPAESPCALSVGFALLNPPYDVSANARSRLRAKCRALPAPAGRRSRTARIP